MNGNEIPEKFALISRVNIHIKIMLRLNLFRPFNFINVQSKLWPSLGVFQLTGELWSVSGGCWPGNCCEVFSGAKPKFKGEKDLLARCCLPWVGKGEGGTGWPSFASLGKGSSEPSSGIILTTYKLVTTSVLLVTVPGDLQGPTGSHCFHRTSIYLSALFSSTPRVYIWVEIV